MKRFGLEAITIIGAAIIVALIANAFASRDRRVAYFADSGPGQRTEAAPSDPTLPSSIEEQPLPPDSMTGATDTGDSTSPVASAPSVPRATRAQVLEKFPPTDQQPFVNIKSADARWLFQQGTIFLDARRTSDYEAGHVAGARNFAVWESDVNDKVQKFAEEGHDADMPIVIYCSGGECQDSQMLAQKLWGLFFNNLLVYEGGYPEWVAEGGPTRTGSKP